MNDQQLLLLLSVRDSQEPGLVDGRAQEAQAFGQVVRGQALELHRLLHHRTVSHQGDGVAAPRCVAALAQVARMARGRVACRVADVLGIWQPQEVVEAVVRRQVPGGVPDVPLLARNARRPQQFQPPLLP